MGKRRGICDGKDDSEEEYSPPPDPSTSCTSGASKCAVCGGPCFTKNFGADACRACAAFFRRAVAGRRNYRCKMLSSCGKDSFQDFRKFPSCKCCRFRRCIKVGMQITGVQIPEFAPVTATKSHSMSYLDRVTAYRSTLFLRRLKFLSERGELPTRFQHTTKELADTSMWAEFMVLQDYFHSFEDVWQYLRKDVRPG
ncbi:zinc finger protein [Aphelenchoides avenae]|nr:zinc finger protein [Aphelenchus avenae]